MELTTPKAQERAANIRKIFLAMARDVRVMIIKLADRLNNMQTLGALPEHRRRSAWPQETLQIFAPLAHRLGIWQFKWQLEDLSFKYLYPRRVQPDCREGEPHPRGARSGHRRGPRDPGRSG